MAEPASRCSGPVGARDLPAGALDRLIATGRFGLIQLDRDLCVQARHGAWLGWLAPGAQAIQALPMLLGYEPALRAIAAGQRPSLLLPRLAWPGGPLGERVIALEVLPAGDGAGLLLWLQDASELAALEQQVVQQRNELSLAEAALVAARAAAEAAHAAKSAFLANLSHDLKSPLQVILGNAALLADEGALAAAERPQFLQDIAASGQFLLAMISDLLEVAALESGRLELSEEPVDLALVLERSLALARGLPGAAERQLACRLPSVRPWLLADPIRLQRILANLLSNAIKFTTPGGLIDVALQAEAAGPLVVTVSDDGCGIDPARQVRLFEPFQTPAAGGGSGLGLHAARGLAELHQGSLTIRSEPGVGTVACLTLPAERRTEPPP